VAITQTAGGTGQNPKAPAEGRSASEGWLWGGYFASRCKGP
jgi:hypothetical protein